MAMTDRLNGLNPGGMYENRTSGESPAVGRRRHRTPPTSAAVTTMDAATSAADRHRDPAAGAAAVGAVSASSISNRASAVSASRRLRSFSRHRRNSLRIDEGVFGGSVVQSASSFNTEASTWETVSPANT